MKHTSFRPCATCAIPSVTKCTVGGCMNNKGKAYKPGNLTAIEKEQLKEAFKANGCPHSI